MAQPGTARVDSVRPSRGRRIGLWIAGWIGAAAGVTALATLFQTQRVVGQLNAVGADVGFGERVSMSLYDLVRFGTVYAPFVLVGLLVAFAAGSLVYRLAGTGRPVVFAVAGIVAMAVMLSLMKQVFFGVQIVAGARDTLGFALQLLAGGVGGLLFSAISSGGTAR